MDQDIGYRTQSLPSTLNAPASVTTYLVCQNTLLQTGVRYILKGTRFVVADDGLADGESPELVLLCDSLPPGAAVETIKQLKEQYPSARVVALSDNVDPWTVRELCTAGLDGLCPTGMPQAAVLAALELVMLGEMFLPISVSLAMLEQASSPGAPMMAAANEPAGLPAKFSGREAQILRLLTTGASNKLIARDLGVAEATVKVHVKAILRKAKAANRTQAAMWATQFLAPATNSPEAELAS
ncbi:LuxR C-terminal-related transcriptional regulator [Microvirga yunnanensis]|uniref:LuxR C-terminal-related transcriptional regulator n=1 Tax=Microvirga yunnanensis TaxID=2953740 RepID=UPI0021C76A19|nr:MULTISPECIES: response regulator transcription factor [unclassified Microvirga]